MRMSKEVWTTLAEDAAQEVEDWMEETLSRIDKEEGFSHEEFFKVFEERFGIPKEWLMNVAADGAIRTHNAPTPPDAIMIVMGILTLGLLIGKRLPHGEQ